MCGRRRRAGSGGLLVVALGLGVGGAAFVGASARANRPPEALEAERRENAAELDHLIRRSDSLSAQLVERRHHLRQRLRAMYKLSQGGYVRLLLGAETPARLFARRDAAERILDRDLDELGAVHQELAELAGVRERLRAAERRAAVLGAEAQDERPTGLARHGALRSPVPSRGVAASFGPYRDATSNLEFTRDGVELTTQPGDPVRAPAAGVVRHVGELPGLGLCVIVDHGDQWATLLGRLARLQVAAGDRVADGELLGVAFGSSVQLQLSQAGVWLDPTPYLAARDAPTRAASPARRR